MSVKARPSDPIVDRSDIYRLKQYFTDNYRNGRLYSLMVTLGCNFGLRAGDLLKLEVGSLRNKLWFELAEEKTGKLRRVYINDSAKEAFDIYISKFIFISDMAKIFESQKGGCLEVKHVHKMMRIGCSAIGLKGNFGSHTLRKTFAHHIYKANPNICLLRDIFNHSDAHVTRLYVNVSVEEKEESEMSESACSSECDCQRAYEMLNL